jgi:hypothetical protein
MKRKILVISLAIGMVVISCSKMDSGTSLKQSVESSIAKINTAASAISVSKGYQLLSVSDEFTKTETGYSDSIDLDMIAGIYDFNPDPVLYQWYPCPRRFFSKTGASDSLIINMPQKFVLHPRYLYYYIFKDSAVNNNFRVAASDYHFYYCWYNKFDYKLKAGFSVDKADIGTLDMLANSKGFAGIDYSSRFTFSEGYNIEVSKVSGDTTTSSFALSDENEILLRETRTYIGDMFHHNGERTYMLTVGNVDIVKSTGIDSIQVFLDGVLQKSAAAKIEDESDTTGTICHHRDILITFDDGTTTNLSELIQPGMDVLRTLVDSMHSMNFAKHVIDYLALNIYYHEYKMPHNH